MLIQSLRSSLGGQCLLISALLLCVAGCDRAPSLKQSVLMARPPSPEAPGPTVLAVYQPWFGDKAHIDIGYSSQDPNVLRQQIARAKDLGIDGFLVNYYGPRREFLDKAYALMQDAAYHNGFKVAMLYDQALDAPGAATEAVIVDLQSAYDHYIGQWGAKSRDAYLRYNGRPVIFIYPHNDSVDWNQVRKAVNTWADPPLLFYTNPYSKYQANFDGFFPWVQPGKAGWARDGSNWGQDYLENFYREMQKRPDKLLAGAVWPGFDDSKASWGQNRKMDPRCGRTFADTMRIFQQQAQGRAPFLVIETWNDHEEGSGIEFGIPKC